MSTTDPSSGAESFDPSREPVFPLTGNWLAMPPELTALVSLAISQTLPNLDAHRADLRERRGEDDVNMGHQYDAANVAVRALLAVNRLDALCLTDIDLDKGAPVLPLLVDETSEQDKQATSTSGHEISNIGWDVFGLGDELHVQAEAYSVALTRFGVKPSWQGKPARINWFDTQTEVDVRATFCRRGSEFDPSRGIYVEMSRGIDTREAKSYLPEPGEVLVTARSNPLAYRGSPRKQLSVELAWLAWRSERKTARGDYKVDSSRWKVDGIDNNGFPGRMVYATHTRNLGSKTVTSQYGYKITETGEVKKVYDE